jgi:hypothetical protein
LKGGMLGNLPKRRGNQKIIDYFGKSFDFFVFDDCWERRAAIPKEYVGYSDYPGTRLCKG